MHLVPLAVWLRQMNVSPDVPSDTTWNPRGTWPGPRASCVPWPTGHAAAGQAPSVMPASASLAATRTELVETKGQLEDVRSRLAEEESKVGARKSRQR